ncbi:MAG TPA: hypothetical protein HA292_02675 [Candidatus Nitrosotenuis sp.]|nr:hypothetical protein [Candidatus Nitrosotenuis sp.]HIH45976.1 hypothetical protein [Candidatus Nitrosotenuis sp.]HIH68644.1 hypothetical protein [Candidatus Nitrosotenuis sp.]HII03210.1 hypothetical protein [Candidatus Nitrosotenuis sp.]
MFDKIITALFICVLGALWFFTRHHEIHHEYRVISYDTFGNKISIDGIRTVFTTHSAAVSFAKHYSEIFPLYNFALESNLPDLRRKFLSIQR